ncbi:MAG TPA: BTAD domain-containing putative transcriptional regulator [Nocardioidaceae bacterium]|nr:BTAD domain-containing putative transcriptional regulator [Nocardioidaceae bacterium]
MTEPVRHTQFHGGETWRTELMLLSGFELRHNDSLVELPQTAERLLAFLAIHDRPLQRSYVAGSLWLDSTDSRSAGSLRSALWRVHTADEHVIETSSTRLRLAPDVHVDLRAGLALARQLLDQGPADFDEVAGAQAVVALEGELLPDWYGDDWLVLPQEQWRQLRLHALEVLADRLARHGAYAAAVAAALSAVRAEPLRESAHRCLVEVHLAEGNVGEALDAYHRFRRLLMAELRVEPSPRFTDLIVGFISHRGAAPHASA